MGQRLNITEAKFVLQIEQGCNRALRAQVRSERMSQWNRLNYETALTEQSLRRCFPRGMPQPQAWRAIEKYAEQSRTQRIVESELYLTPYVSIQCNILDSIRAYSAEAFMRTQQRPSCAGLAV